MLQEARYKATRVDMEAMLKECSQQFQEVLRRFDATEEDLRRDWRVQFTIPRGAPRFTGSLAFTGAQILSCLKPSIDMIVETLRLCVRRIHLDGGRVSVRVQHTALRRLKEVGEGGEGLSI